MSCKIFYHLKRGGIPETLYAERRDEGKHSRADASVSIAAAAEGVGQIRDLAR